MDLNQRCEVKIKERMMTRKNGNERMILDVRRAELTDFCSKSIKSDMLQAFLHVRLFQSTKKTPQYGKWPKKGTLAEAQNKTDVLLLRAYEARAKPRLLVQTESSLQEPIMDSAQSPSEKSYSSHKEESVLLTPSVKSANFEPCNEWRCLALDGFSSIKFNIFAMDLDVALWTDETNALSQCLLSRLESHVMSRAAETKDTWIWQFARDNMSRVAALMVLSGHIHKDVARFRYRPTHCLLIPLTKTCNFRMLVDCSGRVEDHARKLRGCYLCYDTASEDFIRSGKASRPFADRVDDHRINSKLTNEASMQSNFYLTYPSKEAECIDAYTKQRLGWFDSIHFICGFG